MPMLLASQVVQCIENISLVRVFCYGKYDDPQWMSNNNMASERVSGWVKEAARILQKQWPRQEEEVTEYYEGLIVQSNSESYPNYSLSCSYILIEIKEQSSDDDDDDDDVVLGHGRLTECYESAGGNAVAATYIIIDSEERNKGLGKGMMVLLEREARSRARLECEYHFVYLWCKVDVSPFYLGIGYKPSHRVSLHRPCLKYLTTTTVRTLEHLLLQRSTHKKNAETVMLLPSSSNDHTQRQARTATAAAAVTGTDDVWLKKRLVDHVPSSANIVSQHKRINEIETFTSHCNTNAAFSLAPKWYYRCNPDVPWQQQIGPSCGLTAIRMVTEYYLSQPPKHHTQNNESYETLSLLQYAQNQGYTDDGEIFDVEHLRQLLEYQLAPKNDGATIHSLVVRTRDISTLSLQDIDDTLRHDGLWILPYDSNPRTKLPDHFRGHHAHWGIVVGLLCSPTHTESSHNTNTTTTSADHPLPNEVTPTRCLIPLEKDGLNHNFGSAAVATATATSDTNYHFCVQQSLSKQWCIASIQDWVKSNQQLLSIDDRKFKLTTDNGLNLRNKIIQIIPE